MITPDPTDLILCADSGLLHALREGLIPHAVIGDMDSLDEAGFDRNRLPEGVLWITAPRDKDLTDTALAMEYAVEQGCEEILVVGGLGGRFDHSLANLQNMVGFSHKGINVHLIDKATCIYILTNETLTLSPLPGYALSVLSWTPVSTGVTLTGMAFPLTNATLTADFPLGVSNEVIGDHATVQVSSGTLLVIYSKKTE